MAVEGGWSAAGAVVQPPTAGGPLTANTRRRRKAAIRQSVASSSLSRPLTSHSHVVAPLLLSAQRRSHSTLQFLSGPVRCGWGSRSPTRKDQRLGPPYQAVESNSGPIELLARAAHGAVPANLRRQAPGSARPLAPEGRGPGTACRRCECAERAAISMLRPAGEVSRSGSCRERQLPSLERSPSEQGVGTSRTGPRGSSIWRVPMPCLHVSRRAAQPARRCDRTSRVRARAVRPHGTAPDRYGGSTRHRPQGTRPHPVDDRTVACGREKAACPG